MERKNLWQTYSEAQIRELEEVNAQYRTCLDEGNASKRRLNLQRQRDTGI